MSSDFKKDQREVFRSNTLMILIPGACFSAALILRHKEDLTVLIWILIIVGVVTTIAVVTSFTTITISKKEISIKNLRKNQVIKLEDIVKQNLSVSTAKGIETTSWKLHLKEGKVITISSDLFKDKESLKESLNIFLQEVPKKMNSLFFQMPLHQFGLYIF